MVGGLTVWQLGIVLHGVVLVRIHSSRDMYSGKQSRGLSEYTKRGVVSSRGCRWCASVEEVEERRMIRVVNLALMVDFSRGYVGEDYRPVVSVRFYSSLAAVRVGMMSLESVCGACLWGDVTWNRVGPIENKNSIYRRIQSPRSVSFRSSMAQWPISKNKGTPPFSPTESAHYGDPLPPSNPPSSQPVLSYILILLS